ncbi:MAG TPA: permease [Anaerolineales bacterium]|nr:permease [Anaerolineales bacterium]
MQALSTFTKRILQIGVVLVLALLYGILQSADKTSWLGSITAQVSTFSIVFLGIFIEAAPFLLLGTIASGLVEVFINKDDLARILPKNALLGAMAGALLGVCFPVCECGVVPLTRRLFRKGLPPSVGVAFLLAAPVLNPIVIASTAAAFGVGSMLAWRLGLSFLIALSVGLIFSLQKDKSKLLLPNALPDAEPQFIGEFRLVEPLRTRLERALLIARDEFFEMGLYLVAGTLIATTMQTFLPRSLLLGLSASPVISVLALMALAVLLSICSTVDAIIALSFVGSFTNGSILAFLVFGPMVDIKSILLYQTIFRKKPAAYIVLFPLILTLLFAIALNYFGS